MDVISVDWPTALARERCGGRMQLMANMWKPHLNRLFPDRGTIIWVDGDAWLQTWDAVPLALAVTAKGKLAIVSQSNRYAQHTVSMRWLAGRLLGQPRNILLKNAARAKLPRAIVADMALRPTLNAGFYALADDAPHWERLQHWSEYCLRRGRPFTSDQLAIGVACFHEGLPWEPLPEICNYHGGPWRWDAARRQFVEYGPPYAPVSVVHMAGLDALRGDLAVTEAMVDMDDAATALSLRYPAWLQQQANAVPDIVPAGAAS